MTEGKTSKSFREYAAAADSFNLGDSSSSSHSNTKKKGMNFNKNNKSDQNNNNISTPSYVRDLDLSGLGMESVHVRFHHTLPPEDKEVVRSNGGRARREFDVNLSIESTDFNGEDFLLPQVTIEACTATADTYVNGHKLTVSFIYMIIVLVA